MRIKLEIKTNQRMKLKGKINFTIESKTKNKN